MEWRVSSPEEMKSYLNVALFSVQLLICLGSWQPAMAQISERSKRAPNVLTTEQVVDRLVQRNLERAHALTAYKGTRIYRLEYQVLPGREVRK